ncbi:MAG: TIGR02391 family protein [Lysobacter sp.]
MEAKPARKRVPLSPGRQHVRFIDEMAYCREELMQDNYLPCGVRSRQVGPFAAIRNPTAHEPKILWQGEDDAADYFTLLSLLHRRLDKAKAVGATAGASCR